MYVNLIIPVFFFNINHYCNPFPFAIILHKWNIFVDKVDKIVEFHFFKNI